MYEVFVSSLTTALYAVGITLAWSVVVFCVITSLAYLKHMRYYYAIYKHPEVFGDAKDIPWEVKKVLMKRMAKRTEMKVKNVNPKDSGPVLKVYIPDEVESA